METKLKDLKGSISNTSRNDESLKYKLGSLEKSNDFLKLKAQDLEKKFT